MKKRKLGNTGLGVSVLGYGSGVLSSAPPDDVPAARLLNRLLDSGVNYIDTSPDYGRSEELIGRALSGRRSEFFLATKCGCPDRGWSRGHVWTASRLLHNIENSLRRLRTSCVDVWQLHNPPPELVRRGGLLEVMEKARAQGKVRFVSVSTALPDAEEYIEWGAFDVLQLPYGALDRRNESAVAAAASAGVGVVVRGSIAEGEPKGALSRDRLWKFWAAAGLDDLLPGSGSRTAFLFRFALSNPAVDTAVLGTRSAAHLDEAVRAAEAGPLPAELVREVRRRLDAAGCPSGPPRGRRKGGGGPGSAEVEIGPAQAASLPALVEAAAAGGARIRLRPGAGRWDGASLAALRRGLAGLGKAIISGVARGRRLHLDGAGGRAVSGTGPAAEELRRGLERISRGVESLACRSKAFREYLDEAAGGRGGRGAGRAGR